MLDIYDLQALDAHFVFAACEPMRNATGMRDAGEILAEIDRRGISRTEVARVLGISQPNATKLWKPDSRTGKTRALKTNEAQTLMREFKLFEHDQAFGSGKRPAAGHGASAPEQPLIVRANEGAVKLKVVDLNLAMGDGGNLDDWADEEEVEFDHNLLRQLTRAPSDRIIVARPKGDSMFPTVINGDWVLIDTTQKVLNLDDRIWACSIYGAGAVKRLKVVGKGRVEVRSDNAMVGNREIDAADLVIMGRVIWIGREA